MKQAELEALGRRATELARSIEEEEKEICKRGSGGGGGGDVRLRSTADGRYKKFANLKWKCIFKVSSDRVARFVSIPLGQDDNDGE